MYMKFVPLLYSGVGVGSAFPFNLTVAGAFIMLVVSIDTTKSSVACIPTLHSAKLFTKSE